MRLDFGRPDASEYLAVLNGLLIFHTAVAEFSRETVARELGPDIALLSRAQALYKSGAVDSAITAAGEAADEARRCGDPVAMAHAALALEGSPTNAGGGGSSSSPRPRCPSWGTTTPSCGRGSWPP